MAFKRYSTKFLHPLWSITIHIVCSLYYVSVRSFPKFVQAFRIAAASDGQWEI
jgi:hypothetical protein